MKAKVLKPFKDKYSGEIYKVGEKITVTRERFEEIMSVGAFLEKVTNRKKED